MTFLVKSLVSVGTLGALGTAAYGSWHFLGSKHPTTILGKIERSTGKKAIAFSEDVSSGAWKTKTDEYKSKATGEDEKILSKTNIETTKLPSKCREILEKGIIGNQNQEEQEKWASKWCFT